MTTRRRSGTRLVQSKSAARASHCEQGSLLRGTRQFVTRHKAVITRNKAVCYAKQGSLLRGTRHFVTRHKAACYAAQGTCYAAQGSLLRGTRQFVIRHKAVYDAAQCGLYVAAAAVPRCYLCSLHDIRRATQPGLDTCVVSFPVFPRLCQNPIRYSSESSKQENFQSWQTRYNSSWAGGRCCDESKCRETLD